MKIKIKQSFIVFLHFIALTLTFTFVYYRLSQDKFTRHFNGIKRNKDAFINSLSFHLLHLALLDMGILVQNLELQKC